MRGALKPLCLKGSHFLLQQPLSSSNNAILIRHLSVCTTLLKEKGKGRGKTDEYACKGNSYHYLLDDVLLVETKNGVTTMTMNTPKKLNGWTEPMLMAIRDAFAKCAKDPQTKAGVAHC